MDLAAVYSQMIAAAMRRDRVTLRSLLLSQGISVVTNDALDVYRESVAAALERLYLFDIRNKRTPVVALFVMESSGECGPALRRMEEQHRGIRLDDDEWKRHVANMVATLYDIYSVEI